MCRLIWVYTSCLNTGISVKHCNNKNKPDTLLSELNRSNGLSAGCKWVKAPLEGRSDVAVFHIPHDHSVKMSLLFSTCISKKHDGEWLALQTFGSRGRRFESYWRCTSSHDCTSILCIEPSTVTLSLSIYDLNNVERDINHQIVIIIF